MSDTKTERRTDNKVLSFTDAYQKRQRMMRELEAEARKEIELGDPTSWMRQHFPYVSGEGD